MNFLHITKSIFGGRDKDADHRDLTRAQQTNVPYEPRPRGSMPSTRSETTTSSKAAVSSANTKSKRNIGRFLDKNDHMPQDPIEVSDGEGDSTDQSTPTSRVQLTRPTASQPVRRDAARRLPPQKRPSRDKEEERLLGGLSLRAPADAVLVEIPSDPTQESTMPKPTSSFVHKAFRPVNTLDALPFSPRSGKSQFYSQVADKDPKRKNPNLATASEPPKKRMRLDDDSPDILQAHGSKSFKSSLEGINHSMDDLSSSPPKPLNRTQDIVTKGSPTVENSPKSKARSRKIDVPWPPTRPTAPASVNIQPALMVVSDDDEEESFTKQAARQRTHRERQNSDVVLVRETSNPGNSVQKAASTFHVSAQARVTSASASDRIEQLDDIIPDSILLPNEMVDSSPDAIQDYSIVNGTESINHRRSKPTLANIHSSALPSNRSRMSSGEYLTPAGVKVFRAQRMLFGRSLKDASGYELAVDKVARTFKIQYADCSLSDEPLLSDTRIDRIHRVTHGHKGPKVKIETVLLPVIGSEVLLELNSNKLACDLATLLSRIGNNVNVEAKDDSWLDKVFDKYEASGKGERNVAQAVEKSPVRSEYFKPNENGRLNSRRNRLHTDSAGNHTSAVRPGSFHPGLELRDRTSAAGRRHNVLREDLDHRDARIESDPATSYPEPSASRSRTTRTSANRTPPKLPPPIKYSQSGKLGETWKNPLTYPKSGKKRATVNFDDLSRLDDDEFLNDNIIAFFLRYLEHHLEEEQPDISKRSYFFNSYFYEKLRQNPKDKKNINYEGVKKWTDKIGLFNRDFVVVPVNENLHWYVAIICNLSWFRLSQEDKDSLDAAELVSDTNTGENDNAAENTNHAQQSFQELSLEDRERQGDILVSDLVPKSFGKSNGSTKKKGKKRRSEPLLRGYSPHRPAIVTLDSLRLARYTTVKTLKQYIVQEGKERLGIDIDESEIHGVSAKKIPVQNNYSDCGLFVCAYLERFAMNPTTFKKHELERAPQQWPELYSHDLRGRMRDLILMLHDQQEDNSSEKPLPTVGEILLPPNKPPRSTLNGVSSEAENGDEVMHNLPDSPLKTIAWPSRQEERHDDRKQRSDSEDEVLEAPAGSAASIAHMNPTSLRMRTAKILSSPLRRRSGSFAVPESGSEDEGAPRKPDTINPQELVRMLRKARSPKAKRNVRSDSVSTEFLNGDESYKYTEQHVHLDDLDDNENMLV